MSQRPDDRLKKKGKLNGQPKILTSIDIKIPNEEVHIMHPDEKPPTGGGTCSCHSVCTCVPVSECACNMVCTCDYVCSTNTCTCNPFDGCPTHTCSCQPVCSCVGHCSTCSTCSTGHYWYPN